MTSDSAEMKQWIKELGKVGKAEGAKFTEEPKEVTHLVVKVRSKSLSSPSLPALLISLICL